MKLQKKLAASLSNVSEKRIKIDLDKLEEIGGSIDDLKQSITKNDIRSYIYSGVIVVKPVRGVSRARARKNQSQKKKGRRKGSGSRKGTANARLKRSKEWMERIRLQRSYIKLLKEKQLLTTKSFRELYKKAKGGFFRSKRHVKLYIDEHKLIKNAKD